MSRGIRKTGIFIAVMLTVVVLTGCQIAKKDESGQAKEDIIWSLCSCREESG